MLDIGPGSGEWLQLFPKENVTRIYGVEPNRDHHELLRRRIKEAGLSDVYVIVPVGVEDLGEEWVRAGEVDTVVTIQVSLLRRYSFLVLNVSGDLKEWNVLQLMNYLVSVFDSWICQKF